MQMLVIVVVLVVVELLNASAASSVVFQDCGSAYELEAVEIEGCGTQLPCQLTLGDDVAVSVHFVADFTSFHLNQDVVININQLNMETPVTPDPCEFDVCPVPTDCVTSFTSIMSVPERMALNQRGWLRWRVYNERGQLVLCYQVQVQTSSPKPKLLEKLTNILGIQFGPKALQGDLAVQVEVTTSNKENNTHNHLR